jgi:glycosyltransferase involved in cell wall biosynthesis
MAVTAVDGVPNGDAPRFSVVIPVYNESESLDELIRTVDTAMTTVPGGYEIIFVDDGSTDATFSKLRALASQRPEVRIFSFRRNLGKSPALTCGFQEAAGEFVLTLDADLQDDPHNVRQMYDYMLREGVDVVSGWRKDRKDGPFKVLASKIFNLLAIRTFFGFSFRDMNSGLKLYRAAVTKELMLYGGMHRFIPLIVAEMGYAVAEIPVNHRERKYGMSKYSPVKVLTASPDLLTIFFLVKYMGRPLHFFGRIGSILFGVGFVILSYLTYLWAQGVGIGSRPLLSLGVLLILIGGQIVLTGLLADLIMKVNYDSRRDFPLKYSSHRRVGRGDPV